MRTISNFNEMIDFIGNHELTEKQINELLVSAIGVIAIYPFPKQRLITRLKAFWREWNDTNERPVFLETEEQIHAENAVVE